MSERLTPEQLENMVAEIAGAARHAGYLLAINDALNTIVAECDQRTALQIGLKLKALSDEAGRAILRSIDGGERG